jgi:hypothetical protein
MAMTGAGMQHILRYNGCDEGMLKSLSDLEIFKLPIGRVCFVLAEAYREMADHWFVVVHTGANTALMMDSFGRHLLELYELYDVREPLYSQAQWEGICGVSHSVQNDNSQMCGYYCVLFAYMYQRGLDLPRYLYNAWNDIFSNVPGTPATRDRVSTVLSSMNDLTCLIVLITKLKIPKYNDLNTLNTLLSSATTDTTSKNI